MNYNLCRLTMVILCIAGIFFTGQQVEAQELAVRLDSEVQVAGPYFTLGDIAGISGENSNRIVEMGQIKLGRSPQPGQSFVLSREIIMARLNRARVDLADIDWSIPATVKVTALSQPVTGSQFVSQAEQYLKANVAGEATITASGQPRDILVPPGNISFAVKAPYGIRYNAPTSVGVTVQVDGQPVSTVTLRFDIKKYAPVAVTSRVLPAGEIITPDSITFEQRDIGRLPPGYFSDSSKILGKSVKRQLTAGLIITESMLDKPVLITTGKPVNIVAKTGNIEVTMPGIALKNGSEGEYIQVKNSSSRKVITGQVMDETTVRIML
ncbi:flagellar basal body P-ring formation chaperone FlgA [Sporomusa acidovorans]|uniref:SAF domain-containing protein n=1 Tax=Sporomusa acidovorans (strain ATCC 49682 / DSM 3132 / Mol) TaxID=1123286 RepID=A0ABZ3J7Y8_SPOA4|nr:flagellar basal body P-ring formation chaperone FlgA [Sporomusa acidovorans]OZC19269.1 flagellar basal body P-ring biosynthesis protein FlgA [Sporomusa acidovorans DSM 3132]SDD82592.1 flagella basal body P-ring formation protein FlgA [Sporomusa acidovorans]